MSARKGKANARPKGASLKTLNPIIRELGMARATAYALERSAIHGLIEIGCAADGAAAVVACIDRSLDLLDEVWVARHETVKSTGERRAGRAGPLSREFGSDGPVRGE